MNYIFELNKNYRHMCFYIIYDAFYIRLFFFTPVTFGSLDYNLIFEHLQTPNKDCEIKKRQNLKMNKFILLKIRILTVFSYFLARWKYWKSIRT